MSQTLIDARPSDEQRRLDELKAQNIEKRSFSRSRTTLSKGLTDSQEMWLLDYCIARWHSLYGGLASWRAKMSRFERMADGDYSDRKIPNLATSDASTTIFVKQNHTLGMTAGFADFVYAQARDDIYGTRPWLGATPIKVKNDELAAVLPKHAQWKFDQSNIEPVLIDALKTATDLGTQFVQVGWRRIPETSEHSSDVAHSKSTGKPILGPTGDYIEGDKAHDDGFDVSLLPADFDPADLEWKEILIQDNTIIYDNVDAACLDYKKVAFDELAPELDLRHTDFMVLFTQPIHDLCAEYGFDAATRTELIALANTITRTTARDHRQETDPDTTDPYNLDPAGNPKIELVEAFVRCNPIGTGNPIRIHAIFSPNMHAMFRCEYLANDTPKGVLPVFPVRCFKTPNRIIGRGYYEKYEDENNSIDGQHNAITYRNRKSANIIVGVHRDKLVNKLEGQNIDLSSEEPLEIMPDQKLADAVEFLTIPDMNNRAVELLGQQTQMCQMRTGISSAAQGELKGVPQSNTATGVRQIMSRGAMLVKWPVDQMMSDEEKLVQFAVTLVYANQDTDETFAWGEGKDAELLTVLAADVKNLETSVSLTLTQSQSQEKLQNSMSAATLGMQYVQLPETDKESQRPLYVQALASLGFNDADNIIRQAATNPEAILQMLPPELQGIFMQFLQQNGLAPQVGPDGQPIAASAPPTAPVSQSAGADTMSAPAPATATATPPPTP